MNIEEYFKLSHELAKKQLIEKFTLEMQYDDTISLEQLIRDSHNNEVFTVSEYQSIYRESKEKLLNNNKKTL